MMIQSLIFMPILLLAAAVSFAGAMSLRITEKTNLICRQGLLDMETDMVENLSKLVDLNPTAQALRSANQTAKLTMAIPVYGQVAGMSVQEARQIFHQVQVQLIRSADFAIQKDLLKTKTHLAQSVEFGRIHFTSAETLMSPKLAVEAKPKMNLTPDYFPQKNFSELMVSQIKWKIQLHDLIPSWLFSFINIQAGDSELQFSCAASVKKMENGQWQANLIDKTPNQFSIIRARQLLSSF